MNKNFLEIGDAERHPFDKLFLQANDELESLTLPEKNKPDEVCKTIEPTYGFCIKIKNANGEKIFINVCHSSEMPKPPEITETLLRTLLDSDDPTSYRIPMSLADGREERDKGDRKCIVHDIVINTEFYNECMKNQVFKQFLITVALDGIEDKYNATLAKDAFIVLKNKKYHGTMPVHNIKFRPKPLVTELGDSVVTTKQPTNTLSNNKQPPSSENKNAPKVPSYNITKYPIDGETDYLLADIALPEMSSVDEMSLHLGEDRIVFNTQHNNYCLDIFLPYFIGQDNSAAQFNKTTKILKIKMPVILNT